MKEIKKLLRLGKVEYYEKHLTIINAILPRTMTPMEIKVLARFMSIELTEDMKAYRFSSTVKKVVMKSLGISPAGLSNYLGDLTTKQFLMEDKEGNIQILPILFPEPKEQLYTFKLVMLDLSDTTQINTNERVSVTGRV